MRRGEFEAVSDGERENHCWEPNLQGSQTLMRIKNSK